MIRSLALSLVLAAATACGTGSPDRSTTPDADLSAADASTAERQDIEFSSDVGLTGYLTTSAASPPGSPGIVLVHQFQKSDEQWGSFPEELAGRGYRVLAFNLRGHGDSDPYGGGSLVGILSDPDAGPADLRAALEYLATTGGADPDRIAVIGTSIGANLTVASAIHSEAKTYVSLSSRRSAVESLAAAASAGMQSVLYLASEDDGGGVQAADAQALFDDTAEPRQIQIFAGSADHGISILSNHPESLTLIEGWLEETL